MCPRPGWWACLCLLLLVSACSLFRPAIDPVAVRYGPGAPIDRELDAGQYLASLARGQVSYPRDVKPILDHRCVVCHGCYDAPCQLKLESPQALDRGASKLVVFDGARLAPMAPTRMRVDAGSTAGWREKGFYPVLNERRESPEANRDNALLARFLQLKQQHPLPSSGRLADDFDFDLNRSLECPRPGEFDDFARRHPGWGMPYGFPGLTPREHRTLSDWIAQGARYPEPSPLPEPARAAARRWEDFMNADGLKSRLVARYVYEHLFMGHLHIQDQPPGTYFRLVRSTTPPGEPLHEIPTVRPYDDPGGRFWYRLRPLLQQTIVDKNHSVYEIGDARIRRLRALFLEPDYAVRRWPGYQPGVAANPFRVYDDLPAKARYRFLLDDAYYFISGFMKGPVCRGQVALNVIRDQFWVLFYDPDHDRISSDADFLHSEANRLRLPSEQGDAVGLEDLIVSYTGAQTRYLASKQAYLADLPDNVRNSLDALWLGDGHNPNAALTAFRHFDSASLMWGLVGARPATAWVIDYPLFERIHYLLVAGFNVFGSVTHQAATRLYMDNLRLEAENNFLSLFPASARPAIYRHWNRGLLAELNSALVNPYYGYGKDTAVDYRTRDYANELYGAIEARLGPLAGPATTLYRCARAPCERDSATPLERRAERVLKPLTFLTGGGIQYLPELSFLRVHEADAPIGEGAVYSLIQNKALENVSFMFWESARRLPAEDTLTIVPGFVGSYPNFYYDVAIDRLPDFVSRVLALGGSADATRLAADFGVRRTRPDFWNYADFFNRRHLGQSPLTAGLFDLSRYENR
ncbi:fatty acid cis/trans isomerase [Methyloparacoccus murrellii]